MPDMIGHLSVFNRGAGPIENQRFAYNRFRILTQPILLKSLIDSCSTANTLIGEPIPALRIPRPAIFAKQAQSHPHQKAIRGLFSESCLLQGPISSLGARADKEDG